MGEILVFLNENDGALLLTLVILQVIQIVDRRHLWSRLRGLERWRYEHERGGM